MSKDLMPDDETMRIYGNPQLLAKILRGIEQAKRDELIPHELIDPPDDENDLSAKHCGGSPQR